MHAEGCRHLVAASIEMMVLDYLELEKLGIVKDFKLIKSLTEMNYETSRGESGERIVGARKSTAVKLLGFYVYDSQVEELLCSLKEHRLSEWIEAANLNIDPKVIRDRLQNKKGTNTNE